MSTESIKIERIITKRSYGLDCVDRLIQISGDLSPEFKDQLWEDMSIDVDELTEEFGNKEDITKEWNRENELCVKRSLYRDLNKKPLDNMTEYDKELLAILSRDTDLKLLVGQNFMASH